MPRKGILGTKLGMTQVFDEDARVVPVTVLRAGPCPVVQVRTDERDGYEAVQIGYGAQKKPTKPAAGHAAAAAVPTPRYLVELDLDGEHEVGGLVTVAQFAEGSYVDVSARSKGKGFSGVMKRHGFAGAGASHGVHKVHRSPGAIGACATPARVFPGTRMAGRDGGTRVTVQNLEVVRVDVERNLLLVKGAVPGANGGLVIVREAVKRPAATGGEQA